VKETYKDLTGTHGRSEHFDAGAIAGRLERAAMGQLIPNPEVGPAFGRWRLGGASSRQETGIVLLSVAGPPSVGRDSVSPPGELKTPTSEFAIDIPRGYVAPSTKTI